MVAKTAISFLILLLQRGCDALKQKQGH